MEPSRLTVIRDAGFRQSPNGTKAKLVLARCVCGNEVTVRLADMNRSDKRKTVSCGCRRIEVQKAARPPVNLIHGLAKRGTRDYFYHCWEAIKQRCYNAQDKYFHCYGKRGIGICGQWLSNPQKFRDDVIAEIGQRPHGTSLDRKDNNGHYCPGNLRWATPKEQAINRRPRREWLTA